MSVHPASQPSVALAFLWLSCLSVRAYVCKQLKHAGYLRETRNLSKGHQSWLNGWEARWPSLRSANNLREDCMTRLSNRNPGNYHPTGQQGLCLCDKSGLHLFPQTCMTKCRTECSIGGSKVVCPLNLSRPRWLLSPTENMCTGRFLKRKMSAKTKCHSLHCGHGQGHNYLAQL